MISRKKRSNSTAKWKWGSNEEFTWGDRKSEKEIERGDLKWLVVGRSKSQQEIDTQIDRLAGEFQKKEIFE